jgi:transcriptional regulator with XRE-family HTH domain
MTISPEAQVVSRSSSSPLAKLYQTPEFQIAWQNDVPLQVARNVLRLRRFRNMSQHRVAAAMGTSQSALARIESGQENITLQTLGRLISALHGRLQLSIQPAELPVHTQRSWWELYETRHVSTGWVLQGALSGQTATSDLLILGLERQRNQTTLVGDGRVMVESTTTQAR